VSRTTDLVTDAPDSPAQPKLALLAAKVPTALLDALDAEVERQRAAHPAVLTTRASVVRDLLARGLRLEPAR
jgi:hypothetical protein